MCSSATQEQFSCTIKDNSNTNHEVPIGTAAVYHCDKYFKPIGKKTTIW